MREIEEDLKAREEERRASVWVQRESALRMLQSVMIETMPQVEPTEKRRTLFLPLVNIGGHPHLVAEFESLGFGLGFWEAKIDRFVSTLVFAVSGIGVTGDEPAEAALLKRPMLVVPDEPRVCYFHVAEATGATLTPIGMETLKQERIQRALLFNADSPDRRLQVEITPTIQGRYLVVKSAEPAARVKIRAGDYLLTENGRFVGVMVSRTRCYVPTGTLPREGLLPVPLTKPEKDQYFDVFVSQLGKVRELIKDMPRD
jgi:hypothetical protein